MTDHLLGFLAPWFISALVLRLSALLPARRVSGYVRDVRTGSRLEYRLNGPLVFVATIGLWLIAGYSGVMPWDWLWAHRWSGAAGAFALGVIASVAVVLAAPSRGGPFLKELFLGRHPNPRMFGGRVDAKMFLYVFGGTYLELNLLSFAAHHFLSFPEDPSPGVVLYVALFTWFICDYLLFERVHLYTYDLFAERVGFKLLWGCLFFYPYFYGVGLWAAADLPNPHAPVWLLVLATLVFFAGWSLARGANMQKFHFKLNPERTFLGQFRPEAISDGERRLLCSGFWRVSRHVNYLGEILMATGLALSLGQPALVAPWLYPLYYVLLLVPRERDDDRRCAAKYGPLWDEYRRRVPWRIVPRVY
ncbi:MAG: DUF1295 domain-containing protein [Acidobacteria bacterium]|nr:DUF1295 domain-containing protein [Acidobacteriota bacterium]